MIPVVVAVEALSLIKEATRVEAALPATGKNGTKAPGIGGSSSQGPARQAGVGDPLRFGGVRQSSWRILRFECPVRADSRNAGGTGRCGADLQMVARAG